MASFVEFETAADLASAVEALDGKEFKDKIVRCVANVSLFFTGSLCSQPAHARLRRTLELFFSDNHQDPAGSPAT